MQQSTAHPKVDLLATPPVCADGTCLGLCLNLVACARIAPASAPVAILVPESFFLVGLDVRIFPPLERRSVELAVRLPVPGGDTREPVFAAALQALVRANVDHG